MNIILMIFISLVVVILYDLFKIKLTKIRIQNLKEDKLFEVFDDYFKE